MSVSQNMVIQYMILLKTLNTNNFIMVKNINNKMRYHKMYKNMKNMKMMNIIKNKRKMNNNMMRRNHNIKQPGYDVQRHNYRK